MAGIRRSIKLVLLQLAIAKMKTVNRFSSRLLVSPDGPVVSLTTFDARIRHSYLTIESIARGKRKPSRLILWLDDPTLHENLPVELERLQQRGLEVRLSPPFGPHTKYFPYVESTDHFDTPLVTADDDIVYPRFWLDRLCQAHDDKPGRIYAYRVRRVLVQSNGFSPYESWSAAIGTQVDQLNFALGVSGVLYPVSMLQALKQRGRAFQSRCAWADDIWLNNTALRSGHLVCQVGTHGVMFPLIPGSQEHALKKVNVAEGRNDVQLTATYSVADFQLLREANSRTV